MDDKEQFEAWIKTAGFSAVSDEDVAKWEADRARVFNARAIAKQELADPDTSFDVLFASVTGGADGYGMSSRHIFQSLKNLGVKISYANTGQKVGLLYHAPYSILSIANQIKVIYTMFESTKIPDDWHDYLSAADKIIVPSRWCRDVFGKAGFAADVVPLGYDDQIFTYKPRENKREKREDFVFLHYNAYNVRKGFLELVKAFTEEFSPDEPVRMIFKTNVKKPPFPFVKSKYPNIEVISGAMDPIQLADLCYRSDCFVFPSRGEGFGITPIEAMATGMTAIVPNAHGISEYFNAQFMYEVEVEKTCPGIYARYKGQDVGTMSVCSVRALRRKMRYAYEHQDETIRKGQGAAEYVKRYTYAKTAEKLKKVIEAIMVKPDSERKKDNNILTLEMV